MKILNQSGASISSLAQWTRPKKDYQWCEGRSAMELARAWCPETGPVCPTDLSALLASHEWTRDIEIEEVRPEHVTPLPERGEGRNHDLWARCSANGSPFTLCVEAKADEPFGETIGDTCINALKRSVRTGAVRRARTLLQMVFGEMAEPDREPYMSLRYQLLTATAGTALQARLDGARRAALVIHEFQGSKTSTRLLERNAADLQAFLRALNGGNELALSPGQFAGPWNIRIGSAGGDPVHLLLGKVITQLGSR
jgi:hypothetical protein